MLAPCPSDHFDIFWSIGFTYFTKFTGLKKQLQDPKMDQSISRVVHGATSMEPDMTKEIPTLGDLWRPLSHLGLVFGNHRAKQVIGFCSRIQLPHFRWWFQYTVAFKHYFNFSSVGRLCIPQTSTNKMRAFCENRSGKSALICNQQTGLWWVQVIIL